MLLCLARPVTALEFASHHVVILLLPGIRGEDIDAVESFQLHRVIEEGASGWMVCRGARTTDPGLQSESGGDTLAALFLTLGSGSRAAAPSFIAGLNSKLSSDRMFDIEALNQANRTVDHHVHVGALGDLLHRNRLRTAVIGNVDAGEIDRTAMLLLADGLGRVDFAGPRLRRTLPDAAVPFGIRSDLEALVADYDALPGTQGVQALVFGDLHRADLYERLCLPNIAHLHRIAARKALDSLLGALLRRLDKERKMPGASKVRLTLLAPGPSESSRDKADRLAPVVLWGDGVRQGMLTSASTRVPGLVVNTDFLPTVAASLGLTVPHEMAGRPFAVLPRKGNSLAAHDLVTAYAALLTNASLQSTFGGLPTLQALILLAASLAAWRWRNFRLAAACGIALVALPGGFLLVPLVAPENVVIAGGVLALWECGWAFVGWKLMPRKLPRVFGALITTLLAIVLGDLMTGSHWMRQAWMSYSVVEGARYYGIGNEYMGVVIGAACTLFGLLQGNILPGGQEPLASIPEKMRLRTLAPWGAFFALIVVVLGAPMMGAKVGAVPSAGIAMGVLLIVAWRGRLRGRDVLAITAAIILFLGALAILDARHSPAGQTHLIRALTGVGGDSLLSIIRRKLALETYLLFHSVWTLLLLAGILGIHIIHTSVVSAGEEAAPTFPLSMRASYAGLLAGAGAALLCNDSGVTAASLILACGWSWLAVQRHASTNYPL